ncbi:MAG: lipase [Verrucomicrobia bacterium]|nr:lipase [Verrucomicrobiota bacterium]
MKRLLACLGTGMFAACAAPPSAGTPRVRQAVLVHGFAETGASFNMMKERLEKRGIECYVPRLKPSDGRGGLQGIAERLKRDIDRKFGPDSRIAIISFSMGGIVSRYYLQNLDGAQRCDTFITIASPHHGTHTAWLYPSKGAAEMRPGSSFLSDLSGSEARLGEIPLVSYRTPMDLVILPSASSIWERAENLAYPVMLHPLMLSSDRVIADIERRLMQSPTPGANHQADLVSTSTLTGTTPRAAKPSLSATPMVTSMTRSRM